MKQHIVKKAVFYVFIVLILMVAAGCQQSLTNVETQLHTYINSVVHEKDPTRNMQIPENNHLFANNTTTLFNQHTTTAIQTHAAPTDAVVDTGNDVIDRIKTYEDFVNMYGQIINNYLMHYENTLRGGQYWSVPAYESIKSIFYHSVDTQAQKYADILTEPLGADRQELIGLLKQTRDGLRSQIVSMSR